LQVLVADDQPEVRSALRLVLEQEAGLKSVGEATDARDLLIQVKEQAPDLVLLDWELPGLQSSQNNRKSDDISPLPAGRIVEEMRRFRPDLKVIVLIGRMESRANALSVKADSFVCKGDPPEVLVEALRKNLKL
jgi:DNA-binding NarL/FixJ family response regulator